MRIPPAGSAPCLACLLTRLDEAGFSLRSQRPLAHSESELHPDLLARLDPADGRAAAVGRIDAAGAASLHKLLPVPNCPLCSGRQSRSRTTPSLEPETLADPLLGIVSSFEVTDMARDPEALCYSVAGRIHVSGQEPKDSAYSQSVDIASARAEQLGETVERYAGFRPEVRRLVVARANELPYTPPLRLFNGFDAKQRAMTGYRPLTSRMKLAWIEGRSLRDGGRCFVPAASVFLKRTWNRAEPSIDSLISHGLAAHTSIARARRHALFEVYERFHITSAWHRGDFGVGISPSVLPGELEETLERLHRARLDLYLMNLVGPKGLPVVLAAVAGDRFPWIRFGSAARNDVRAAAARATLEACGGWQRASTSATAPLGRLAPLTGAAAHAAYYATRARAQRLLVTLSRGTKDRSIVGRVRGTTSIVDAVLELSPHAVEVCITPPDCRACGFEVVKIVAVGLPLIHFGRVGTPSVNAARFHLQPARRPHPYP